MTNEKIGRNDPCPCGSGRKYKYCCLGKEGVFGNDLSASEELRRVLSSSDFGSEAELQEAVQVVANRRNTAPRDDFQGLSPEQMYRLLYFPLDSPELARFPDTLSVEPDAPIVRLVGALVEGIGEEGVKATAKGNLPRALCHQAVQGFLGEEAYREHTQYFGVNREDDFHDLHAGRLIAELAGLIRKHRGRFVLTRRCRDTLRRAGMAGLYPHMFHAAVAKFNWSYGDGYEGLPLIQQAWLFSLYLLHRHGDTPRPIAFYEEAFLRAFPMLVNEVHPSPYWEPQERVKQCCGLRAFHRFAIPFGLAHQVGVEKGVYPGRERIIVKTPLLEYAVNFMGA